MVNGFELAIAIVDLSVHFLCLRKVVIGETERSEGASQTSQTLHLRKSTIPFPKTEPERETMARHRRRILRR
jgi:hypothetical protein